MLSLDLVQYLKAPCSVVGLKVVACLCGVDAGDLFPLP